MFEPGTLIEKRFRVGALVGEGGMGAVYRGTDSTTGEAVAIKVLKATVATSAKERFLREARVLATLDHPGIVRFKHLGSLEDGQAFLVMEWLEGEDLARRIERQGVTFLEGVRITRGAAEALASAHAQGLVHRDVKPANVFLVGGRPENVKVLDFGIARGGPVSTTLTDPGMAMGTPAYMAPEQAKGGANVDARADIFALGCLLYECLAGAPPFQAESPIACLAQVLLSEPPSLALTVPGIPRALDALVSSMLQKEPSLRPDTAAAVARELGAVEPMLLHEGTAGTISARQVSLNEKRVAAMLVARDPTGTTTQDVGETLSFEDVEHAVAPARQALSENGGTMTVLSDGTILAVFSGAGSASDLARGAAAAALDLRARIPERAYAIATDLANVTGASTSGAAVSRAFGLAAAAGVIRVDATTRALIGDSFVLRGTEGGTALVSDRSETALPSGQLVGRARELAAMRGALAAAREDELARAVLLIGPAGQGKSALLGEFLRALADEPSPPRHARVRCDPARSEIAFWAAAEMVERLLVSDEDAAPAARRRSMRSALAALGRRDAPPVFLEHLLGLDAGEPAAEVLQAARDPRLLADRTLEEWVSVMGAVVAERPLVLVVESLHACDTASVRLLDRALGELQDTPLLIVATARPEIEDAHPRAFSTRLLDRIQLAPLAKRAAQALVRSRLGSGADAAIVDKIVEDAAGNPMFLIELANAMHEGLTESPPSILALLQGRLERLEANARRILRAGSVFGETFWSGAVQTLVGHGDSGSVAEWLDELVRRDVLVRAATSRYAGEVELAFRHALLRDAAYATLTDADLVVGHRLAAEWLTARGETDPLLLARHFELGKLVDGAVEHLSRAAIVAFERNDLPKVLEIVRRIEEAPAGTRAIFGELAYVAVRALYWSADYSAAIERADRALVGVEEGSRPWIEIAGVRLRALAIEHHPRFLESLETMLGVLEANPVVARENDAVIEVVMACLRAGNRPLAERALRVFGEADSPFREAYSLRARSWIAYYDGALDTCVELDKASAIAFERAGYTSEMLAAQGAMAYGLFALGFEEEAKAAYEATLAAARRRSLGAVVFVSLHNLGIIARNAGDAERAVQLQREAAENHRSSRGPLISYMIRFHEAAALADLGRWEEVEAILAGLESAPRGVRAIGLGVAARLAMHRGDSAAAVEHMAEAMKDVADGLVEEAQGEVRNIQVRALLLAGRADEARAAAKAAYESLVARSSRIVSEEARASFLERVRENADTTRLLRELGGCP